MILEDLPRFEQTHRDCSVFAESFPGEGVYLLHYEEYNEIIVVDNQEAQWYIVNDSQEILKPIFNLIKDYLFGSEDKETLTHTTNLTKEEVMELLKRLL